MIERKEILRETKKQTKTSHKDGGVSETLELTERAPKGQSWNKLIHKTNMLVLEYNSKCKINFHDSIP